MPALLRACTFPESTNQETPAAPLGPTPVLSLLHRLGTTGTTPATIRSKLHTVQPNPDEIPLTGVLTVTTFTAAESE